MFDPAPVVSNESAVGSRENTQPPYRIASHWQPAGLSGEHATSSLPSVFWVLVVTVIFTPALAAASLYADITVSSAGCAEGYSSVNSALSPALMPAPHWVSPVPGLLQVAG